MEEVRIFVYVFLILFFGILLFDVVFIFRKTLIKKEEVELPGYKPPWAGKKGFLKGAVPITVWNGKKAVKL